MAPVYPIMIVTGLFVGGCVGYVMHRSDYCMAGMFRDLFLFRSTTMIRTLVLYLVVTMPLFELVRFSGLVVFPFPKYGPPSGANLLGGLLFGIGMVLAGGCAVGTLYKMGAGSFPSLLAFLGMITGSVFFAFLYPFWSRLAVRLKLSTSAVTVPELLGSPAWLIILFLVIWLAWLLYGWFRTDKMTKPAVVDGYLQPWKTAVFLALLSVCFLIVLGLPMGVTTSNAKFGAILMQLSAPDLYATIAFFHKKSFVYQHPWAGVPIRGGAGAAIDGVALVQFPLILGIILGAAWSAVRLGEWRMRFRLPWRQVCSVLCGGIIMGLASRMAPSCNVWHLYGGLPILGLESMLFLAGMLPGSWLGGLVLTRFVMPEETV